jgi:hypothetical protein
MAALANTQIATKNIAQNISHSNGLTLPFFY